MSGFADDLARWLADAGFQVEPETEAGTVQTETAAAGDDPWGSVEIPVAHLSTAQLEQLRQSARWLTVVDDLEAGGASASPATDPDGGHPIVRQ